MIPDGVGELTDGGQGIEARRYNMARRRQKRLGLTTDGRTTGGGRAKAATVLEDDDDV